MLGTFSVWFGFSSTHIQAAGEAEIWEGLCLTSYHRLFVLTVMNNNETSMSSQTKQLICIYYSHHLQKQGRGAQKVCVTLSLPVSPIVSSLLSWRFTSVRVTAPNPKCYIRQPLKAEWLRNWTIWGMFIRLSQSIFSAQMKYRHDAANAH